MREDLGEIKKLNIGNSGEYYIAALLSARNFTTTLTLGRAERYDILAVAPSGKTYKFSVKTRFRQEHTAFTLSARDEKRWEEDLFYVLVRLHEFRKAPEYWVIPSKRVSEVIASSHQSPAPIRNGGKLQAEKASHTIRATSAKYQSSFEAWIGRTILPSGRKK